MALLAALTETTTNLDDDQTLLLKLLGTGGGNVNEADAHGDTALHRAGQDLHADRVASLIAAGADVNALNHRGRIPLHNFVEKIRGWDMGNGSKQPLQLLLKSKPNVNAVDHEDSTPLHVLAAADTSFKKEATRALLHAGADPNLRDKRGRTPVHLLLQDQWPWTDVDQCIEMFVAAKVDLEPQDLSGDTPLHIAARTGGSHVFNWLVKQGASLSATNYAGETPELLEKAHGSSR